MWSENLKTKKNCLCDFFNLNIFSALCLLPINKKTQFSNRKSWKEKCFWKQLLFEVFHWKHTKEQPLEFNCLPKLAE